MQISIDRGWLPDIVSFAMPEGGLLEAKNFIPSDEAFLPATGKVNYTLELPAPTGVIAFPAPGGTLPAGTYYYRVVASDGIGTTIGSVEVSCTIDGLGAKSCGIMWSAVAGATSYRVYGRVSPQNQYWTTTTTSYRDDGTAGTSGSVPTENTTNRVVGTPLKGIECVDNNDNNRSFIGTSTKLYRLNPNKSLNDVSKLATTYNAFQWSFAQYGNWVVATNFNDVPQVLKGFTTSNFIDLGGNPPKAKYCLFWKGHLIFAYLNEDGVPKPKKLKWSAKENIEDYAISITTGADEQELVDADGAITGIITVGDRLVVFHENSITTGFYTGAPYTFSFPGSGKISNVGAIPNTIISIGSIAFFWDRRDLYMYDGNTIEPIGFGVRNTVLGSLDYNNLHRISVAYDPRKGLIYWLYPIVASDGTPNKILVYNFRRKVFTYIDITAHCIWSAITGGVFLEDLDVLYPEGLDSISFSLDDPRWQPNTMEMVCVNTDGKVNTLSGSVLTGTLETGEFKDGDNIIMINRVRPKISKATGSVKVSIGVRFLETENPVYSPFATVGSNGYADIRYSGRFIRGKLETGQHEGITGIEFEAIIRGKR